MTNFKKLTEIVANSENKSLYGSEQLKKHDGFIKDVFNGKVITYIDSPTFGIDKDGNIPVDEKQYEQLNCNIALTMMRRIKNEIDLEHIKAQYLYILELSTSEYGGLTIRLYETNLNKKKVTFTISENIYNEFSDMADKMAINKSKFMENKIVEFISKNK